MRAYATALEFISMLSEEDRKSNFVNYMPNIFHIMLNTAGMLVMKIVKSSYSRYVDIDGGKRLFSVTIRLLRKATLEDNDLRGRGSKIMTQLWNINNSQSLSKEREPNLSVKSRLGASVLHDALWIWRDEFGGQKGPPSGPSQPISNPSSLIPKDLSTTSPRMDQSPPGRLMPAHKDAVANINGAIGNSDEQVQEQMISSSPPNQNFIMEESSENFSNFDWVWDTRFAPVLPMNLDSYSALMGPFSDAEDNLQYNGMSEGV